MKRIGLIFLTCLLCLSLFVPAMASPPLVVDDADLLTDIEEIVLLDKLGEISSRQGMDVVVVTTDSLGGKSPMAFADDYYDYNGYAEDGILLLISMEERDCWISTAGYGIVAFTDAGIDYLFDQFIGDLSDGQYADAFETYADTCDSMITRARQGNPYDVGDTPRGPFPLMKNLFICTLLGFGVAFIATGIMRGKLRSVRAKPSAADYVLANSLQLTRQQDVFLYKNVSRREKSQSSGSSGGGSSTHRSSSGRSHGGGGRKF